MFNKVYLVSESGTSVVKLLPLHTGCHTSFFQAGVLVKKNKKIRQTGRAEENRNSSGGQDMPVDWQNCPHISDCHIR